MRNSINKIVFVLLAAIVFTSCDYSQNNVQTLITDDCGQTYTLIPAGQAIPKRVGVCQYKVSLPNAPMQGEAIFKANFKDDVLVTIDIDYDYSIVDPIEYIDEAKYLGKANSSSEDEGNSAAKYELAENSVIDKVIKSTIDSMLIKEDIIEYNESEFEDILHAVLNKKLEKKGIQINYFSFVPTPTEQTKQAIDVATAMKIYKLKGLEDVGKAVIVAKAGAPKISVTNQTNTKSTENE